MSSFPNTLPLSKGKAMRWPRLFPLYIPTESQIRPLLCTLREKNLASLSGVFGPVPDGPLARFASKGKSPSNRRTGINPSESVLGVGKVCDLPTLVLYGTTQIQQAMSAIR